MERRSFLKRLSGLIVGGAAAVAAPSLLASVPPDEGRVCPRCGPLTAFWVSDSAEVCFACEGEEEARGHVAVNPGDISQQIRCIHPDISPLLRILEDLKDRPTGEQFEFDFEGSGLAKAGGKTSGLIYDGPKLYGPYTRDEWNQLQRERSSIWSRTTWPDAKTITVTNLALS